MSNDPDFDVERIEFRLRVAEALARALGDLDLVASVQRCTDADSARATLQDTPFGFLPFEADFILDAQIRSFTMSKREAIAAEIAMLRTALDRREHPKSRATRPPESVARMFTPPSIVGPLQRLVPGPIDTARFADGELQVTAVEIYRDAGAVQWRHELLDPERAPLSTFGMAPQLSDDAGTDYLTWDLVSGGHHAERFGRLRMIPAPPATATRLSLTWGHVVLGVDL